MATNPEMDLAKAREEAHWIIDVLPEDKLAAVRGLLEVLVEPLAVSLRNAPLDDEELTPETVAQIMEARASTARGEGIPHEQIMREFGL